MRHRMMEYPTTRSAFLYETKVSTNGNAIRYWGNYL